MITCGYKLLETNSNAREPLLTLARHLKATSNVSDSWGEGFLGAIGLKKETISNKYDSLMIINCDRSINFIFIFQTENYGQMFSMHNIFIVLRKVRFIQSII